nr:DUF4411 family protein [Mesorhizobium sp.]
MRARSWARYTGSCTSSKTSSSGSCSGAGATDPFVIAKAASEGRGVVTMEEFKPNGAKIPNICRHFEVECMSLEEFMEREGWEF